MLVSEIKLWVGGGDGNQVLVKDFQTLKVLRFSDLLVTIPCITFPFA